MRPGIGVGKLANSHHPERKAKTTQAGKGRGSHRLRQETSNDRAEHTRATDLWGLGGCGLVVHWKFPESGSSVDLIILWDDRTMDTVTISERRQTFNFHYAPGVCHSSRNCLRDLPRGWESA